MKKTFKTSVLALSFLAAITNGQISFAQDNASATMLVTQQANDQDIEAILKQMTLEEKVGQMTQITLDVITIGDNEYVSDEPVEIDPVILEKAIKKYKVGSILNTANNRARTTEKWNQMISQIQALATQELKAPVLYGVDAIHGTTYTAGATFFPQQIGQAATWNRTLVKEGAEVCAYETRASSIPWDFSPVLDLGRDARWARMWETFGEDVYLVSEMGAQVIDGYEGVNNDISNPTKVASCLKHYLGYSSVSGKDRTPAFIPNIELRERYLVPFQKAVEAGAHTVMVNSGIINGTPVHANHNLITEILKEELGFDGLVVTDWADIENLHNRDKIAATHKEAVKLAINAGIDMSMVPYNFNFCEYLVELVNEGEVSMERIDDAVRRVLKVKKALGLFETPVMDLKAYPEFGSKKSEQIAYNAALESITLLKNEKNVLPLAKGTKVLVTGPNANSMRTLNGGWTYSWQGEKVHEFAEGYNTILEAIQKQAGKKNVTYTAGVEYKMDGQYYEEENIDIQAAVKAAANVDVIILCVGENTYTEKPGDLNDLYISENQEKLAKALAATGKPVVLVLNEGRPRLISKFEEQMTAVVQTYLPGNFGGEALADLLYGEENFSGKLPYTYPKYPNSLVTYDMKPSEAPKTMEGMYNYGGGPDVQYPFGYGLSYTTFEYKGLKVTETAENNFEITVNVKNTGDKKGKEVVQLFISDLYASITPDLKRLRGFEKIELAAGESKEVKFTISPRNLAFVNADLNWVTEKGEFLINIGDQNTTFHVGKTHLFENKAL